MRTHCERLYVRPNVGPNVTCTVVVGRVSAESEYDSECASDASRARLTPALK